MSGAAQVRVVVLNYEGGETTLECLRSVLATDWPSEQLDVVLVDNASHDGIAARVRVELPSVRVVESPVNVGFAGGCNLGLSDLDAVDHVALLNNDTTVEPGWLAPLVAALEQDDGDGAERRYGAACPKIVFASPMVELELTCSTRRRGRGDRRDLGVRVSGARVDGRDVWNTAQAVSGFWGPEPEPGPAGIAFWTRNHAVLRVPPGVACELRLDADVATNVGIRSGGQRAQHVISSEPAWYRVPVEGTARDVINNAGSILVADGYGADRGYLEIDRGQWDEPDDVFAWCGAAVLLRREYLEDTGLLDERLFLYYEDFELAWRGRDRGWSYRYEPASVVKHVHSAATVASSALHDHYSERNHLAMLTRHAPPTLLARALVRYGLVTASYARRDIAGPLARGKRPRLAAVGRRARSFAAYLRLAPAMVASRRTDRDDVTPDR